MPKLIIDDFEIEVPEGTKVIEAAERLGIMIPRFCYHEAMGSVGACRMCAVKFLQGPFKGVQMSCMIDAKDGMVVSTTDEEAVAFRKQVIEWLMVNHPHDCPVCDEGGQCLLQDETVSSGHGIRRFPGPKRTYRDQYLGIFIQHEMNRCIHCYRCSRFYQEFSGYKDLGAMQITNKVYFGRFEDGQLESPFSGNLVDICPVGVYTDKTARFKVRRWDLERSPSLCVHCSLGCNTIANARYRATMRIEGRFNPNVNGYFICDRGRFAFSYANGGDDHTLRPWTAKIGAEEAIWSTAMQTAAERLARIGADSGPDSVACVGSPRSSLETLATLKRFCRVQGWSEPAFFMEPATLQKVKIAVSRLDKRIAVSLRAIEKADFVLAVGVDPLNEAPMLAYAMRQAWRNDGAVAVIDPRPIFLPMGFEHIPAEPDFMEACMAALIEGASGQQKQEKKKTSGSKKTKKAKVEASSLDPAVEELIASLSNRLREAKNPVIVCGIDLVRETTISAAADHALSLSSANGKAGLFYLLPGANAYGASLLSADGNAFAKTVEAIESGSVKALVAVESDPLRFFPDRERLERALDKLDFLLVMDYLHTDIARRADVLLPTTTIFETGSSFINNEGRLQFAQPAHMPGIPLYGGHPPRVFRNYVPGGEPKAAWLALSDLAGSLLPPEKGSLVESDPVQLTSDEPIVRTETFIPGKEVPTGNVWSVITGEIPALSALKAEEYPFDNVSAVPAEAGAGPSPSAGASNGKARPDGSLELLLADWMYGTDELSAYSDTVQPIVKDPCLYMHTQDAARAGVGDGDRVRLRLDRGTVEVPVAVSDKMAPGVIVLPRHYRLAWQKIGSMPVMVPPGGIERV